MLSATEISEVDERKLRWIHSTSRADSTNLIRGVGDEVKPPEVKLLEGFLVKISTATNVLSERGWLGEGSCDKTSSMAATIPGLAPD